MEFVDYQDSDLRENIKELICQTIYTFFKLSDETKMEDSRPPVTKSLNVETKHYEKHCLEYLKVSIPMQRTKSTLFPSRLFL